MPPHGWTCFHCGMTFTDFWAARSHFGTGHMKVQPSCIRRAERAELAGLKDVGDDALVERIASIMRDSLMCASCGLPLPNPDCGHRKNRVAGCCEPGIEDCATAVIAAIAPALIARERERAAKACKSIAKQELEAGNYISAAIAKMIEERIRAGAAP